MGLETATFISSLVATNPAGTDQESQGDDHLRLIKSALQATFPTATKAHYFPDSVSKSADYTVLAADMNKTILCDTTAVAFALTMPSLGVGDAGWQCWAMKTNTGTNPYFITPPSGTIQSGDIAGLVRTRRSIPGSPSRILWTGTAWIAERVPRVPVGTVLDFTGATLPVGYEWPNGQTLGTASTNYADFYTTNGNSGVTVDMKGRVSVGKDNMGGSAAGRITATTMAPDGTTLGAIGGEQTHVLVEAELASHTHVATPSEVAHKHFAASSTAYNGAGPTTVTALTQIIHDVTVSGTPDYKFRGTANAADIALTSASSTGLSVSNVATGSGTAHNNMPPAIVLNKILVVE